MLPEEYIAGLVDGEGCFSLQFRKNVRHERRFKPAYYSWKASFAIALRSDDAPLLARVADTLNCGRVYSLRTSDSVRYDVQDIDQLCSIVVPFFRKHALHGKKSNDFELWAEAVGILRNTKRRGTNTRTGQKGFTKTEWSEADLQRLKEIHCLMKQYKAKRSKGHKWVPPVSHREIDADASRHGAGFTESESNLAKQERLLGMPD